MTWDKLCDPKNAGVLNITSLIEWNLTTMLKLLWNLEAKADKLLVKRVDEYYIKEGNIMQWQAPAYCYWMLKRILKCRDLVIQNQDWDEIVTQENYKTAVMYKKIRGEKEQVN